MRAPEFWQHDGLLPRLLAPLGALYAAATAYRVARPGWRAPVPVLCIGNPGAGGYYCGGCPGRGRGSAQQRAS